MLEVITVVTDTEGVSTAATDTNGVGYYYVHLLGVISAATDITAGGYYGKRER